MRTVTVREPEFTHEDRLLLLAHERLEAEPRNQYGVLISEATNPEIKWAADQAPAHDRSVKAVKKAQDRYYKQWPDADSTGDLWGVRKV